MRICAYQNNGAKCKNWIVSQNDEDILCALHAGVLERAPINPPTPAQAKINERMMHLEAQCDHMSNEELETHIEQLAQLKEDLKLREQAASASKSKRVKALVSKGASLTEAQKAELESLRNGPRVVKSGAAPAKAKLSTEEKAMQNLEKLGLSREQIIAMMKAKAGQS